jgi:hypothetical protein
MLGSRVRGSSCIDTYGAWTNIHLVYVRVPGKGIAKHRRLRGDDDTGGISIENELGRNSCG